VLPAAAEARRIKLLVATLHWLSAVKIPCSQLMSYSTRVGNKEGQDKADEE
jgi:hypothetical protein